jgi:hypothetical protein
MDWRVRLAAGHFKRAVPFSLPREHEDQQQFEKNKSRPRIEACSLDGLDRSEEEHFVTWLLAATDVCNPRSRSNESSRHPGEFCMEIRGSSIFKEPKDAIIEQTNANERVCLSCPLPRGVSPELP